MLYPVAWTLWLSLNGPNTAMRGTPDFKGLDNYVRIAGSSRVPGGALADAADRRWRASCSRPSSGSPWRWRCIAGLRGSKVFSAIVALPLMVAPVVGALAWRFIFVDGYGMIDFDRRRCSAPSGPLWFADIWLARASIVIANLWMALPFDILVLLAGLASLPTDPIEAAQRRRRHAPGRSSSSSSCRC